MSSAFRGRLDYIQTPDVREIIGFSNRSNPTDEDADKGAVDDLLRDVNALKTHSPTGRHLSPT